jgi:hypothetical protein
MNKQELKTEFERLCKIADNLNKKIATSDDTELQDTLYEIEDQIERICDLYNYYED